MRVLLVGRDFDFSGGDGISRYSAEMYKGLSRRVQLRIIATQKLPRTMRVFYPVSAKSEDIVHLMYPDVLKVSKGDASMLTMWHDMRVFTKYSEGSQQRYKPKLVERFNIASSIIKSWAVGNYHQSDALLYNSSQTLKELSAYMRKHGFYERGKSHAVIPLGVDPAFLRSRVWDGERKDFAYIGSIHLKHKNLTGMLRVFERIAARSDSRLHVFTSSIDAQMILKEHMKHFKGLSDSNVILHFRASDAVVARYLQTLAGYLHLSKYEGQGIPILEAIAAGTNALTLKGSTIPPETTRYAFRGTEAEIVEKAISLAQDSRSASKQAVKYARSFTWERTVKETMDVYRRLLGR
ncbi:MAG: glycosyltransferase [Candidatus Micrarchaeota archaeon]|nr:glycosyltransferase [Candidatus Micrarchaeota archaeon]